MRCVTASFLGLLASGALCAAAWSVREDGVGPVQVGMTVAELSAALGQPVALPTDEDEANCFYVQDKKHKGLSYMLTKGRVARVDVLSRGIATLKGAQVGDEVELVRKLFGPSLEEAPHFYSGMPNLYLTHWTKDRRFAVRFETDEGKVVRFYAGKAQEVGYVEGCL